MMPVPYSNDLRWRIVWLNVFLQLESGDIARLMHISERSVYRFAERYKATGDVRLFAKRNGPRRLLCESEELLLIQQILLHPGIYLRELQDNLFNSTGRMVDASTICRTVHRLGFTRQKIKHVS